MAVRRRIWAGDTHGFVDSYLNQKGHSRRIAATVNHFSIVPQVLRESNLIAAVPKLISQDCGFVNGLWTGELPFGVDPGIAWLRTHVEGLLQGRWHDITTNSPCGHLASKVIAKGRNLLSISTMLFGRLNDQGGPQDRPLSFGAA